LYQMLYAEEDPHQDRNVRIHIISIHIVRFHIVRFYAFCTIRFYIVRFILSLLNYNYIIHTTLSLVILRIYNHENPYKLYFKILIKL